jgi:carboxyl-terminal processing protease
MVGTPAYKAGILAGDLIVKIDGKSTENMRLSEAIDLIQGKPGDPITLTVLHEGSKEAVDIPLKRDTIKIENVTGDLRRPDNPEQWELFLDKKTYSVDRVGYIRLTTFSKTSADEMRAAVTQLQNDGAQGLIIDLRNNPGGLLQAAVEIADLFLDKGRIVSTKGRNEKEEIYDAKAEGTLMLPAEKYPIVILINKYSASASEILSAALQDHGRAVIVGERSYGKGSVQNIIKMEGGTSALKLTTASYWRPSGKNIHRFPDSKDSDEWGVKPDAGFDVPMKDEERLEYMLYRNDRDVVRSKKDKTDESGTKEEKKPEKKDDKVDKKPFTDRVLEKAIEHIKKQIEKKAAALDVIDFKKT